MSFPFPSTSRVDIERALFGTFMPIYRDQRKQNENEMCLWEIVVVVGEIVKSVFIYLLIKTPPPPPKKKKKNLYIYKKIKNTPTTLIYINIYIYCSSALTSHVMPHVGVMATSLRRFLLRFIIFHKMIILRTPRIVHEQNCRKFPR